ncbi:MAG: ribosome assembly RNA-binding protein YhbY [Gammaproteobacteria bacterium]
MLTDVQHKHLRRLGHPLKPTVMIGGSGLTDRVAKEIEQALDHHELIKVRVRVGDRKARDGIISRIAEQTGAELVQRIGNVAMFYKKNEKEPKLVLTK